MAPLTVPNKTHPCVGVDDSPTCCITRDPCLKTLTMSPRWNWPTSCICWRSSSVVAALQERSHVSISLLFSCANNKADAPHNWTSVPVLLAHKQVEWIFSSKECVIIQYFHRCHPVGVVVPGHLQTSNPISNSNHHASLCLSTRNKMLLCSTTNTSFFLYDPP